MCTGNHWDTINMVQRVGGGGGGGSKSCPPSQNTTKLGSNFKEMHYSVISFLFYCAL